MEWTEYFSRNILDGWTREWSSFSRVSFKAWEPCFYYFLSHRETSLRGSQKLNREMCEGKGKNAVPIHWIRLILELQVVTLLVKPWFCQRKWVRAWEAWATAEPSAPTRSAENTSSMSALMANVLHIRWTLGWPQAEPQVTWRSVPRSRLFPQKHLKEHVGLSLLLLFFIALPLHEQFLWEISWCCTLSGEKHHPALPPQHGAEAFHLWRGSWGCKNLRLQESLCFVTCCLLRPPADSLCSVI